MNIKFKKIQFVRRQIATFQLNESSIKILRFFSTERCIAGNNVNPLMHCVDQIRIFSCKLIRGVKSGREKCRLFHDIHGEE